jgi:predicted nucleic acid-binding protein
MLTYMLDTNICIYVIKNYPPNPLEKFNALAEQLCIYPGSRLASCTMVRRNRLAVSTI